MNLEQQLKQAAEPWLAEERLSQERAEALAALIKARSREQSDEAPVAPVGAQSPQARPRSRFWWAARAAVAAAVILLVTVPVVTGMASDLPVIGPFVSRFAYFDRGTEWALQQRYITPVGLQSTDKGYTFRVEGVMADPARTKIFWVIEGPNLTEETEYEIKVPHAAERGWYKIIQSEVTDGRVVGSTTVGPLHEIKESITLSLVEVAGVKGNWSVSFDASRAALDSLARRVETAQKVEGDGWALTVGEVLFAPTQTVVKATGSGTRELEILSAHLLADGAVVPGHSLIGYQQKSGRWELNFDRLEHEPAQLALLIDELGRVENGGPVLDLTQPGATVEAEGTTLNLRSISTENGKTTVTLAVSGGDEHLSARFRDWRLIGAAGTWLNGDSVTAPKESGEMTLTFDGELTTAVKLAARQTVKTVARDLTVTLPTK